MGHNKDIVPSTDTTNIIPHYGAVVLWTSVIEMIRTRITRWTTQPAFPQNTFYFLVKVCQTQPPPLINYLTSVSPIKIPISGPNRIERREDKTTVLSFSVLLLTFNPLPIKIHRNRDLEGAQTPTAPDFKLQ